jgi:hypothetical protein
MSGPIDEREFYQFCSALKINTKEFGMLNFGHNPLTTQTYLQEQLIKGLDEDVHEFVILKARQLGISTYMLALDLYFISKFTGLNGALITHTDKARDQFRTTLELYRAGLHEDWQVDAMDDNRNQLVLQNGSRLAFEVAGTKAKSGGSTLGRSGALTLCHSTETAYYGDPDGIDSLRSSFAKHNTNRLFIFESTASGFNHFEEMWREAKQASTKRAIFIGWWHHSFYRLDPNGPLFARYWGKGGRQTKEERMLRQDVLRMYGEHLDEGQVAWYRYMQAEEITDEARIREEFPWTEEMAFVSTGSNFFRSLSITQAIKQARATKPATHFRVETGAEFWHTRILPAKIQQATLTIWQEPVAGAYYCLGCDPAFGSSDTADNNVIEIYRCWYNRIEQVAEFADPTISTHAVAWVFAYLCGYYGQSTFPLNTNLEVNGPGQQVLAELQNLRRQASSKIVEAPSMREVVRYIKHYLYRKIDTFNKPSALHTKTNHEIKERMMNAYRDYFERGILIVRSSELVEEMKTIIRDGGSAPSARSGKKDDRVVGSALAVMCWNDQLRQQLLNAGIIWAEDPQTGKAVEEPRNQLEKMVQNYFTKIGLGPASGVPPPKKVVYRGKPTWREKIEAQRAKGI